MATHDHAGSARGLGWARAGRAVRAALALAIATTGCSKPDTVGFDFDFRQGQANWVPGFADYPAADEASYGLVADYRALPPPLETSRSALYLAGTNYSDDLWMYYRAPGSLEPNTAYRVTFDVEIATEVPSNCVGVGGQPGESVTVKAGVSLTEPGRYLDEIGIWRLNVDKGQQANGGRDALVMGDLANSRSCEAGPGWELKSLSSEGALTITTGDNGSVWLFVGTDSGFEARSDLYIVRYVALFKRL